MKRASWGSWVGLVVASLSVVGLLLVSSQVQTPRIVVRSIAFAPSAFPILSLSLLGFLGIIMILCERFGRADDYREIPGGQLHPRVLVPIAIFLGYVLLVGPLGMYPATVIAVVMLALNLGVRNSLTIGTLAVSTPLFIWAFFERTLGVVLPEGSLMGLGF